LNIKLKAAEEDQENQWKPSWMRWDY